MDHKNRTNENYLLQQNTHNRLERKRSRTQSQDLIEDQQEEHCQKKRRNEQTKYGDCVQTHSGNVAFQQHNNLQLDDNNNNNNNNNNSVSQFTAKPCQYYTTVDHTNNSTVVSPNVLGNNISGDVNFNIHVQNVSHSTSGDKDEIFQNLKNEMKTIMEKECSRTFEGCASKPVGLNKMYTELFIINDDSDPINTEHEIWQDEKTHEFNTSPHTVVTYNQILQSPDDRDETVKIVLTKGIAGIGKTVTIQKFILDWANGKANQDLELVFLLPFRELNLLEGEKSLLEVLFDFYPTLKKAKQISEWICDRKVLLILDGLDEYRQPLNFKSRLFSCETEKATVDVLLVNLLLGKLLPSAHLWITSRPVAAGQLPSHIFKHGYKTQIRGFRDEQKEKYFKRQFDDPALSQKVISHLKSQKSLWILCHIPLFSWITSYVLKHITAKQNLNQSMPSNQTEMYIHYLLIQTGLSHKKYKVEELSEEDALQEHRDQIMNMAELAYWQLREQKAIFRKEDLMKYNIIVDEATQHPGILTCISQYKCMFYNRITLFSFVHLTVQEFFAALFAFHEFLLEKQDSLSLRTGKKKDAPYLSNFLKDVIDVALQSENGHMDLFTCFLFGISCDSNKLLLEAFLPPFRGNISQEHRKVTKHIKSLRRKDLSSERCVSLIRCLLELKDKSFLQNLQELERSQSKEPLTLFQCTLLAYQLRMSDEKHITFDLRKYNTTLEGFQRLSSAFRYVRKALLKGSGLTEHHCMSLVPYLRLPKTHLTDLNLSYNGLGRSALAYLTPALSDPNCQIQILNLSHNDLQSQDMELIRDVLTGANVNLKVLDLSENHLEDSGVQILSDGLQSDNCHLKVLKISGCQIQIRGVHYLLSSLKQHPLYLRELDLRYNNLEDTGLENLWAELSSLRVSTGGVCGRQPGLHKYMVALTFDPKTANDCLLLNEDNTLATRLKEKVQVPPNEQRFDTCNQVLSHQRLTGRCFFTVDVIGLDVHVGVACKGLERKGSSSTVCLGHNKMSWSFCCSRNECVAYHDKKRESVQTTESIGRLGVFVDQEAGSVCFYRMIPQVQLLYMFDADFPEDQELYAAFRIQEPNSSVDLDENCSMLG